MVDEKTGKNKNKPEPPGLKVLAAQTLKIASINGLGALDKLEHDLEDEINYENRSPAKTAFGRFRRAGEHKLHNKAVLVIIVILNIVDTLLVMSGLILDFHRTSLELRAKSDMLDSFNKQMGHKYSIHYHESSEMLQKLLDAEIIFNTSSLKDNTTSFASDCARFLNTTAASSGQSLDTYMKEVMGQGQETTEPSVCFQVYTPGNKTSSHLESEGETEEILETVAHKLHYCSMAIISVLVVILLLKLICFGKRFFKERMLIFDGLVTIISFALDIAFMKGVTFLSDEQIVFVLTLLFPWRVIRILNSLIAAVLDKQRLNLKILYTQKKKISRNLTETNSKVDVLQRHIEVLQALCAARGIGDNEVSRAISGDSSDGTNKTGGTGGLSSMIALGKLAFQAADAFAPVTNGYKKIKSGGASPASTPYSSPRKSDILDVASLNENNNAIIKNQNDTSVTLNGTPVTLNGTSTTLDIDNTETSVDTPTRPPASPDAVTVHINGSGPPKDSQSDVAIRDPDHADNGSQGNETEYSSRL